MRKSTIKTDDNEDLEELEIEDAIEAKEKVDFRSSTFEAKEEISRELEWLEKSSKYKTSDDITAEQYLKRINDRNINMANNKAIADSFEMDTGINTVNLGYAENQSVTTLPDSLFMDNDLDDGNLNKAPSVLQGNLSKFYDIV